MKITEKDIAPGRVFYCVDFLPGRSEAKLMAKIIVTSFVNTNNNIKKPWFTCIHDYRPYGFDWEHKDAHDFLHDIGIGACYNMHRMFTTEESALDYVKQCNSGVFVDKTDQEYYDSETRPDAVERRALFDEFDYDYFCLDVRY
ncbi:hypothetical protein [Klebsiella phage 05F01]|nr:hypothetical protein [Klebsiella phage 05F01]